MMDVELASSSQESSLSAKKLPPQHLEAERCVLGGILIDVEAVDRVREIIDEKDFYPRAHQILFNSILELSRRGIPPDLLTLSDFLKAQDLLEAVGGVTYISSLIDEVPSAANIATYAKLIREKSVCRQIIQTGTAMIEEAYQGRLELTELLDKTEKEISAMVREQLSSQKLSAEAQKLIQDLKTAAKVNYFQSY